MIEARVAWVPHERPGHIPPLPTAKSWRFLKEQCNVAGVRLQFNTHKMWDAAYKLIVETGLKVHGNLCVDGLTPTEIEQLAFDWVNAYPMASVSGWNEIGYTVGFDGIPDWVKNFWLPFYRGVRRANPDIPVYGVDAESVETQAIFEATLLKLFPGKTLREIICARGIHNYGDQADPGVLRYATMAGDGDEPGFASLTNEIPTWNTEIDEQQWKEAIARGDQRGIATDEELNRLIAFSLRMRDEFHLPVITFGPGGEYFCTRIKCGLWRGKFPGPPVVAEAQRALGIPDLTAERLIAEFGDAWSTWTYGPEPVTSEAGKRLAAVFAKPAPKINHGKLRQRAS